MKYISRITAIIFAMQGITSHANLHQTMMQQSSSQQVSSQIIPQGGSVTIGGQTFQTEPGQSITIQGGGVTTKTQSTQMGDEPAVTITEVEKRPITVTVDGQTSIIDDPSSTTVTIDPSIHSTSLIATSGTPADVETMADTQDEFPTDLADEPHEGIIRRTGQTAVQATQNATDVAVQTTEGAVDTVRNFFGNLFGR